MPIKDLHSEPFDKETIAKLEIFEDYAQAWLPTFVMQSRTRVDIFDFFAGTGYDINGVPGSPIRLLGKIKEQIDNIFQNNVKIFLHLNEFETKKFELLKGSCLDYLEENRDIGRCTEVKFYNEDFAVLFPKLIDKIRIYPSLVYLDQNGIKFLSKAYISEFEKCKETDFLYFVSSSYFWRFANQDSFKMHFNMDIDTAKRDPYKFIHVNVLKQFKNELNPNTSLKLYPFSLKKGANIHGIIFGATHPKAVDKFLRIAWKRNEINGEANFDIYDEKMSLQLSFFEQKKPTKIKSFQNTVKEKVLNREITNNYELYDFCLDSGHIGTHGADCLKEMKKDKKVWYDGSSPLVTYDNVYKNFRKLEYKPIKDESK